MVVVSTFLVMLSSEEGLENYSKPLNPGGWHSGFGIDLCVDDSNFLMSMSQIARKKHNLTKTPTAHIQPKKNCVYQHLQRGAH